MTKFNQIYKCDVCGNIINIIHPAVGDLVCCNKKMILQEENKEEGKEKHLPVFEHLPENVCKGGDGIKVKIGEIEHPMNDGHYIEWIEIKTKDNKIGRKFFNPNEKAEVEFHTRSHIDELRVYCNIHGLWKIKVN